MSSDGWCRRAGATGRGQYLAAPATPVESRPSVTATAPARRLAAAQALALSLLVFGARLLVSLLGGVVLLVESATHAELRVKS